MRNIVIVEAISTGYNLVEDARRRGYNPIVLELPGEPSEDFARDREKAYNLCYERPTIIRAHDDYNETLSMVKELDPVIVLQSSEGAVGYATRLAEDLGLKGNPTKNIPAMTMKNAMHEALKKAGIRYIRGKVITKVDEAIQFCKENGFDKAVVKPIESAGSQGLFLCDNLDEVENAVSTLMTYNDIYGRPIERAIVQERITGTEYIVNTASCMGKHRLNSILRYKKVKTPEGGYIYDYAESVNSLEHGHTQLVEYAFQVADAIGFQYGVIHGEYMLDDKGPVLIEVNCRPMGAMMEDRFLDSVFGEHESDVMMDTYLDPKGFSIRLKKPYCPIRQGALKLIMIPKDMDVENHPIWVIAKQLRSLYKISVSNSLSPVHYKKTRDLETAGGVIFLVHDDEDIVNADLEILRTIEKKYFSLLFNEGTSRRWFVDNHIGDTDFENVVNECNCYGAILAAGDNEWERAGVQTVTPQTIDQAHGGFDFVIIGYQVSLLSMNESECLDIIFKTIDKVKSNGIVIIPHTTYEYLSYKKEGAEVLMRVKGLEIQAPIEGRRGYVIGMKK
ncbi:MAG: ATP-grasp domain-containing protein [Lachnospiraceae bacterium]|nr:ATP-grasp domain-containing protein [Lachnospiraceae bacterium]